MLIDWYTAGTLESSMFLMTPRATSDGVDLKGFSALDHQASAREIGIKQRYTLNDAVAESIAAFAS